MVECTKGDHLYAVELRQGTCDKKICRKILG